MLFDSSFNSERSFTPSMESFTPLAIAIHNSKYPYSTCLYKNPTVMQRFSR
uniref:Uncharacterized protein n=1 Tax=Rhizophora mucronata TaxID=61149 RepID=A0A2P2NL27_RHIMU